MVKKKKSVLYSVVISKYQSKIPFLGLFGRKLLITTAPPPTLSNSISQVTTVTNFM